ncbi:MAG: hypothetical protein R3F59_02840 [Myxococcota bacterium]
MSEPSQRRHDEVDELFGEGGGAVRPRYGLIIGLLVVGVLLGVFGMACTPAAGALFVLLALYVADKEVARVESGYLPVGEQRRARRIRNLVVAGVVALVGLFALQLVLLSAGVYDNPWEGVLQRLVAVKEAVYPAPSPPPDPVPPAPPAPAPAP